MKLIHAIAVAATVGGASLLSMEEASAQTRCFYLCRQYVATRNCSFVGGRIVCKWVRHCVRWQRVCLPPKVVPVPKLPPIPDPGPLLRNQPRL